MPILGAFIVPHPPIIIPEIGRGEEKKIQKTIDGYYDIARQIAELEPDTIVLTTPHSIIYSDYFHISPGPGARGDFGRFGAWNISVLAEYDEGFVKELMNLARKRNIDAGTLGERDDSLDHGTMVPLYFINQYLKKYKLVRIGLSGLPVTDHYKLGRCIKETADKLDRKVVFVASGDLSHKLKKDGPYGFSEEGVEFDRQITEAMKEADFLKFLTFSPDFCEKAAECGLRSFIIMAGALSGLAVKTDFKSYEGPFGVGYGICAYTVTGEDDSRDFDIVFKNEQVKMARERIMKADAYVKLARLSLETYVKTGKFVKLPEGLPEEMLKNKAGVFVSIKKYGHLRGCIGTITPATSCIAEEIIRNAVSAGLEDPRFTPVTENELDDLVYSVDVLSKPEPIQSMDQLDVKRYGVIVSSGLKRGLLLPNLEGVDTVEEQVAIARRKAGISDKEKIKLERFEVIRHQ